MKKFTLKQMMEEFPLDEPDGDDLPPAPPKPETVPEILADVGHKPPDRHVIEMVPFTPEELAKVVAEGKAVIDVSFRGRYTIDDLQVCDHLLAEKILAFMICLKTDTPQEAFDRVFNGRRRPARRRPPQVESNYLSGEINPE